MDDNRKAQIYDQLMYESDKISNRISSIKGESLDLNERQLKSIRDLENKLRFLMETASRL